MHPEEDVRREGEGEGVEGKESRLGEDKAEKCEKEVSMNVRTTCKYLRLVRCEEGSVCG